MSKTYTTQDVLEFLQEHFIMELATASAASRPAASVMLYATDTNLHFYCATHNDSYKAKNMLDNPQVALTVWEHQKMMVQVDGVAEQVREQGKQAEVLDMLADAATHDTSFWPPVFRIKGGDYIVFHIIPTWIRVLDLTQDTMRQEDEPFTTIIDITAL
jgi:nitroimidazol reductase NimA-like FMN-containing flavoprotein (pyridoxamine 5'-phosphate oxidase superfamily)